MKSSQHFFRKILMCLLLAAGVLAFTNRAMAQDSKGKDFWITFPGNYDGLNVLSLFISGDQNTTGNVSVPGLGFSQDFTVTAGTITTVIVPSTAESATSNVIEDKGVHITSVNEVTVYGLNRQQFTTDAFLALPTDVLGLEHIILGYKNSNVVNGTQFAIVASQNNTTVTITPTLTTDGHPAGVPYNIVLNQGQTYLLRNTLSAPNDLSGSVVLSDKPIAVFGSHQCANIPPGALACDYLVEQLPAVNTWGKNFVNVPLKTRLNGDTYRVIASVNGTAVNVNGVLVATLNRGQVYENIIAGPVQITSSQPVLVAQYSNGTTFDNVTSDPFMMLIPPFEQFLNGYTISTPASGFAFNFVNIVAPNAAVGVIKLDGVAIPASAYFPIGSTGFSGAQLDLTIGAHTINGSSLPFGVFVYGFDQADSYGYPGGLSLAPIASATTIGISPLTGSGTVGTEACFNATVNDQNGNPLEGIRVDFNITGPNSALSGIAFTNASGVAQFCYTGANAGADNITASVGTLNASAAFTWNNEEPVASSITISPATGTATVGTNRCFDATVRDQFNNPVASASVSFTVSGANGGLTGNATTNNLGVAQFCYTVTTAGADNITASTGNLSASSAFTWTAATSCNISCSINVLSGSCAPGQAPTTIYLGYGQQSVTLKAMPTGGTGNGSYTYLWSTGSRSRQISVRPTTTTTYTVTVKKGNNCISTCTVTITVIDIRCGCNKVKVCKNGQTYCISKSQVSCYLNQGATLGACGNNRGGESIIDVPDDFVDALPLRVTVSPNPTNAQFVMEVNSVLSGTYSYRVMDAQGKVLELRNSLYTKQPVRFGDKLKPGIYFVEVLMGTEKLTTRLIKY